MDYRSYQVQDFVLDRKFKEWIYQPNKELHLFWQEFLQKHPQKAADLAEARKILLNVHDYRVEITPSKSSELWYQIEQKAYNQKPIEKPVIPLNSRAVIHKYPHHNQSKQNNSGNFLKVAAVLTLLILAGLGVYLAQQRSAVNPASVEDRTAWVEKSNPWGQKSTVFLSDGSEVKLNAGSTIRYQHHFTNNERKIYLEGEAFFKVMRDTLRPFRVVSRGIITEALGTSFNIEAYNAEDQLNISLVSGKVAVRPEDPGFQNVLLDPGESVNFSISNQQLLKNSFNEDEVLAWTNGILLFKNASESEVIDKLQKWYGVEFEIENASTKLWSFTAEFNNKSLENVLLSIGFTMDFRFRIENDKVSITYNP
jgi:ferric-dicitrate binding protein FerR (iron transport regulator)